MRVLILDGFKDDTAYLDKIYKNIEATFHIDDKIERIKLSEKSINLCIGCFGCWLKKPGKCLIKDDSEEIVRKIINSDIIVYFTPVIFGGYSSDLKKVLDRSICLVSPFFMKIKGEMHHKKRYDRYPSIIGIGIMDRHDREQEDNFKNLIYRNSLNFHSPYQCSEIIFKDDTEDIIKKKMSVLVSGIEVN